MFVIDIYPKSLNKALSGEMSRAARELAERAVREEMKTALPKLRTTIEKLATGEYPMAVEKQTVYGLSVLARNRRTIGYLRARIAKDWETIVTERPGNMPLWKMMGHPRP